MEGSSFFQALTMDAFSEGWKTLELHAHSSHWAAEVSSLYSSRTCWKEIITRPAFSIQGPLGTFCPYQQSIFPLDPVQVCFSIARVGADVWTLSNQSITKDGGWQSDGSELGQRQSSSSWQNKPFYSHPKVALLMPLGRSIAIAQECTENHGRGNWFFLGFPKRKTTRNMTGLKSCWWESQEKRFYFGWILIETFWGNNSKKLGRLWVGSSGKCNLIQSKCISHAICWC